MNKCSSLSVLADKLFQKKEIFHDFYFETSSGHNAHYEEGKIEEVSSSSSRGVGTRIISSDTTTYAHAPSTDFSSAVECLLQASKCAGIDIQNCFTPIKETDQILDDPEKLESPDYSFMHGIDRYIRDYSELVTQISMRHDCSRKKILILKDSGEIVKDERFYSTFIVQVIVQKGSNIQTGLESRALSLPLRNFQQKIDPRQAAVMALKRALLMIDAPECPAGEMPVILSGEAGGTMIHEACGHGLEADIIQKDFSVYREKLGTKVASEHITLLDDGTLSGYYGSLNVDDEGTPSQRTVLIEKGILKNVLTDYFSSRKGNLPLSGNARRSSYRNIPLPRMTNTFILPGNSSPADLIHRVSKGLLVKKMGGGEVNPTSGDFVFQVTEGYLIENGRITTPVRGAILTGNGPQVLEDIIEVGNDLSFMPGICGKSGQSIPVTDGQPTLYIKNMIVGGKETGHEFI